MFYLILTDFQDQQYFSRTFQVLENAKIKFKDFPGFPGPVRTLGISFNPYIVNLSAFDNIQMIFAVISLVSKLQIVHILQSDQKRRAV